MKTKKKAAHAAPLKPRRGRIMLTLSTPDGFMPTPEQVAVILAKATFSVDPEMPRGEKHGVAIEGARLSWRVTS